MLRSNFARLESGSEKKGGWIRMKRRCNHEHFERGSAQITECVYFLKNLEQNAPTAFIQVGRIRLAQVPATREVRNFCSPILKSESED